MREHKEKGDILAFQGYNETNKQTKQASALVTSTLCAIGKRAEGASTCHSCSWGLFLGEARWHQHPRLYVNNCLQLGCAN